LVESANVEYTTLSKESKMGKQQKIYTREFKVKAVQLVKSSGASNWPTKGSKHFQAVGIRRHRRRNCADSSGSWKSPGRSATF
jgi:hypothetical protein